MKVKIKLSLHFLGSLITLFIFVFSMIVLFSTLFNHLIIWFTSDESIATYFVNQILLPILPYLAVILFCLLYGWWIGSDFFYILDWILLLSKGVYHEPNRMRKKTKSHKKPRFNAYQDIFIQLRTLTETLQRNELERKELEKMRKEWTASISHDLKTPLTYIKGYSYMLSSDKHEWSEKEKQKFTSLIRKQAIHMENIIEDLNTVFHFDNGQFPLSLQKKDITQFVHDIVIELTDNPLVKHKNISIKINTNHFIPFIFDEQMLKRALNNLIMNAIIHNPAGTEIMLSVEKRDHLVIEVSDNGVGMNNETLKNLFNRYYRGTSTKIPSEGTGLGMSIAKQLIEAHQGSITVESTLHEGTVIYVSFKLDTN
ncbi:HAMP domain-containing sensor histidine kinase [Lysinibacillus sp. fls2-241-R2A-57]|uniref:sensor histidine kinase n=1 Tax=Lysinibacillus sp. fls2-241-R2A-57 TaxID=3040292 RepID=UPI002557073B|nr:HAMP domain-containing sensor histidine kinase [Lysinibacillus sp. fls2-241-R2A-57]